MRRSSVELVDTMETVHGVVKENLAASAHMAANSNALNQAIENIASVSEENSAAVEEVSASTEEVSAQVEEVSASASAMVEMAQKLQQVVDQFRLNLEREPGTVAPDIPQTKPFERVGVPPSGSAEPGPCQQIPIRSK